MKFSCPLAVLRAALNLLLQVEAKPAPKDLHGFELVQEQYLAEYNSQALLYRHKKTGARKCTLCRNNSLPCKCV